jgi:hypothetical protein
MRLPNALFIVFICLGEFRYRSISSIKELRS